MAGDESTPVVFETMVFGGKYDGTVERYSSYVDAVAGHASMVVKIRNRIINGR
jgi:hypothetical protein